MVTAAMKLKDTCSWEEVMTNLDSILKSRVLAVQWTLKSLLQHHSSKPSVIGCSAFFTVQLLHPYMATGKTIALTRWTFVGKVMSLLFNVLSRLVITFLPKFNFMATVTICSDFGAQKNKV